MIANALVRECEVVDEFEQRAEAGRLRALRSIRKARLELEQQAERLGVGHKAEPTELGKCGAPISVIDQAHAALVEMRERSSVSGLGPQVGSVPDYVPSGREEECSVCGCSLSWSWWVLYKGTYYCPTCADDRSLRVRGEPVHARAWRWKARKWEGF